VKILLLVPEFLSGNSFLQQPLCLLNVAANLEKRNINVDIIDNRAKHYSINKLMEKIKDYDVIAVTTTPYDQVQNYFVDHRYYIAKDTINTIKIEYPNKLVIVCGAHGTVRSSIVKKEINFDILIKGEYDYVLPELVERLNFKRNYNDIPNLIIRNKDKYIKTTENLDLSRFEFDNTIIPAYHKINMNDYFGNDHFNNIPIKKKHWCIVQCSRGCPFECVYCNKFFGSKLRYRSINSIINELKLLEDKYNIEEIFFIDSTFTVNKRFVMELCNAIVDNNIKIKWGCETRVDCVDDELLELMSKANCKTIWFGIESFSNSILELNKKGVSIDKIISAIKMVSKYNDIETKAFIMLGMMGETKETLEYTLAMVKELRLPYTKSIIVCTPRYDTLYYKYAMKQYPFLEESFYNLNLVKGMVNNEITELDLYNAINLMRKRN